MINKKKLKDGDELECEAFFNEFYKLVLFICYSICGDWDIAADACQVAFMCIFRDIGLYDESKSLKAWVSQYARYKALNMVRKNKSVNVFSFSKFEGDLRGDDYCLSDLMSNMNSDVSSNADWTAPNNYNPEKMLVEKEDVQKIEDALLSLSEEERDILIQRYYIKNSRNEVSQKMGIGVHTVDRRVSAAKKKFKESYGYDESKPTRPSLNQLKSDYSLLKSFKKVANRYIVGPSRVMRWVEMYGEDPKKWASSK